MSEAREQLNLLDHDQASVHFDAHEEFDEQLNVEEAEDEENVNEALTEAAAEALEEGDREENAPIFAAGYGAPQANRTAARGRVLSLEEDEMKSATYHSMKAYKPYDMLQSKFSPTDIGLQPSKDPQGSVRLSDLAHLGVSTWSYETEEAQADQAVFGDNFLPHFGGGRKLRFTFEPETYEGASERIRYLLGSTKSWLSAFKVRAYRDPALMNVTQLDQDFDTPKTPEGLIQMARTILTFSGYVCTRSVTTADVAHLSVLEMLQVYHTFMRYVRILSKIEKDFARKQYADREAAAMAAEMRRMAPAWAHPARAAPVVPPFPRPAPAFAPQFTPVGLRAPVRSSNRVQPSSTPAVYQGHEVVDDEDFARGEYSPSDGDDVEQRVVQFIQLGSAPSFHGREDRPDEAKQWLRQFLYVADCAKWNNRRLCDVFALHMKNGANYWMSQLPKRVCADWKLLRAAFWKSYCAPTIQSAASLYFNARRHTDETPDQYMLRLNSYARQAGIFFDPGEASAEDHVAQYLTTVGDQELMRQFFGTPNVEVLRELMQRFHIMKHNLGSKSKAQLTTSFDRRNGYPSAQRKYAGQRQGLPYASRSTPLKPYVVNHDMKPRVAFADGDDKFDNGLQVEFGEEMYRYCSRAFPSYSARYTE